MRHRDQHLMAAQPELRWQRGTRTPTQCLSEGRPRGGRGPKIGPKCHWQWQPEHLALSEPGTRRPAQAEKNAPAQTRNFEIPGPPNRDPDSRSPAAESGNEDSLFPGQIGKRGFPPCFPAGQKTGNFESGDPIPDSRVTSAGASINRTGSHGGLGIYSAAAASIMQCPHRQHVAPIQGLTSGVTEHLGSESLAAARVAGLTGCTVTGRSRLCTRRSPSPLARTLGRWWRRASRTRSTPSLRRG